jgi:histidine triad (HIT) family protein
VLTETEWRALDALRAGDLRLDDPDARLVLARAAEKLRVASVAAGDATADETVDGGFRVPVLSPCPYCENFAGRYAPHGPPAVIAEDELTCAFLAPAPLTGLPGHTLVVTRRHAETIFDLRPDEEAALGAAIAAAARAVRAVLDPPGLLVHQHNGVAAFQTVPHVHVHVVPKAPGPFPPATTPEIVPHEERARLARVLRAHWGAGQRPW